MVSKASKPKKSNQELNQERLQARQLDEEIGKSESRFKSMARNKLGAQSLLAGTGMGEVVPSAAPKGVYKKLAKKKVIPPSQMDSN